MTLASALTLTRLRRLAGRHARARQPRQRHRRDRRRRRGQHWLGTPCDYYMPTCLYYSLLATYCFPLAAYYLLPTTYFLLGDRVDRGRGHREQRHCLRRRELRGRHARHAQAALTLTLTLKPR